MSQRWKTTYLPACGCLVLGGLLLCNAQTAAQGFQNGISLCVYTVLPALFPFFVLCDLLLSCPLEGRLLGVLARLWGIHEKSGAAAVLLSWFGGYAVCAQLTGSLYRDRKLSERESALVMMLGCCSSPGFVISCVGGFLLGNLQLGVLLYGMQLAANLLSTAFCLPLLPQDVSLQNPAPTRHSAPSLPRSISSAVNSSLQVCGCVLFFRTVAAVLLPYLPNSVWSAPVVSAFLEISSGCADFASLGGRAALYGCCACLSLLGVSVWAQILLLSQGAVPLRLLLIQRCIHLACFLFMIRLSARYLPGTSTVYRTLADRVITTQRLPLDAAIVGFVFLCAALYKVRQNFYNK